MIKHEEALEIILENTKRLGKEKVFLKDALYRILAEDIVADRDNPPADNSGMDGFAVRYDDIKGASEENPVELKLVGEAKAGGEPTPIKEGEAAAIYTGGLIPEGADTVIQKELTEKKDGTVLIKKELQKGANIRRQGEDFKKGDVLIKKGKKIRPAEIGVIASVNKPTVEVYQVPRVGILTTGDEILDLGEPITSPSQIRTSNTYALQGQVLEAGGIPVILGFAKDDPKDLKEKLSYAKSCDVLLTTGGVSVGDYDLVKDFVCSELGVEILFWKVAQKPGKPVAFGVWGEEKQKLFFGIPGNPVACMFVFHTLVRPAIKKMMGFENPYNPTITAIMEEDYKRKKSDREEFLRVSVRYDGENFYAKPFGKQGSNILTGMVNAHGFGVVPIGVNEIKKGEKIKVVLFDTDVC